MASTREALQWLLVFFNILSMIIAILAFVFGAFNLSKFTPGSPQYTEEIVQLITACVLLLSSFLGCCAAVHNSIPTLATLILILLMLSLTHIWKLIRYDEAQLTSATEMLVAYKWIEELHRPGSMRPLEEQYECCGKLGFTDYTDVGMFVPTSCYRSPTPEVASTQHLSHPFIPGCVQAVKEARLQVIRLEWIAHWFMIGFEIFGIFVISLLIWRIVSKQRRYHYY